MKKLARLLAAAALILMPFQNIPLTGAAVDTCTWTGAINANWSEGGNWTGCDTGGVPEFGDSLIFPESASNKTTTNDFVGAIFETVQILGSGYTLNGGSITIEGTTPLVVNQSATINLDITYAPSMNAFLRVASTQTLTMNGVTNFSGVTGEVNVGGGGFSGTIDFVGNITGDAGSQVIATNDATAIVRGVANTFTASTVGAESDGVFECRSTTCFGDNANNIYSGNGIVELRTSATYSNDWETSAPAAGDSWLYAYASITISGNGTVNDGIGISQQTDGESLQFTGDITNTGGISVFGSSTSAEVHFDGAVSGADGFSFGGATTYMSGSHTYDGTNTVNSDAIVVVDTPSGLGSTAGITNVLSGSSVRFDFASDTTVDEPFQIAGSGIGGTGSALANVSASNVTLTGTIALDGDATIQSEQAGADLIVTGVISGTGDLTLNTQWDSGDSGSIEISGAAPNTFTGDTVITGGVIYFEKTGAIPSNLFINNSTPSTNRSMAYFYTSTDVMSDTGILSFGTNQYNDMTFGENGEVIGGLEGSEEGNVRIQTDSDRVIIDQDHNSTYDGTFYTDGGIGIFEKRGTGILTLTGNSVSMSDEITFEVSEGTLIVNGNVKTTNGGDVVVTGGALKGSGTTRTITMNGGTIAPGNSPGTLNATDLTLTSASVYQQEIAGTTPGTQYDQLVATGAVILGNATLTVSLTTTPADGTVFTIITAGSVSGTFNGLANGATLTVSGVTFRVNYTATTVTLTKLSGTATSPTSLQSTGVGIAAAIFAGMTLMTLAILLFKQKKQEA